MTENKKYGVIYADPPWYFKNYSAKGTGRAAVSHYDVMSLEELKAYPVAKHAAKDCALFMWATDPMLPEALALMDAWGFKYKTVAFHWAKANKGAGAKKLSENPFFTGLGYWTRANPELCLLGTRGKPKRMAKDVRRLVVTERREHSRKPIEVYEGIERLVGGPYLELFARETREGWDAIGNQLSFAENVEFERRQPSNLSSEKEVSPKVAKRYAAEQW